MTHLANHSEGVSHDAMNRLLARDRLTGRMVWEHAKGDIVQSENRCIVFDDSVLDKNYSRKIEMGHRQYSGNAHGLIRGIGMVNCLYVNPETGCYWIVDYRIFDPGGDGKNKDRSRSGGAYLDRGGQEPAVQGCAFDSWYATKKIMMLVESLGKIYYYPLKGNRLVDDSGGQRSYVRADGLCWGEHECVNGKVVKINGFPKDHRVKLFRVGASNSRTDWIATNDLAQNSARGVQEACALRWKIEQFHRELKQLTGVEKCQCRRARIQRNHIACAVLVWTRLTSVARKAGKTIYKIKNDLLSDYLRSELRSPSVCMSFA